MDRTSPPFATMLHYPHLPVIIEIAVMLAASASTRAGSLRSAACSSASCSSAGGADVVGIVLALASAGPYATYILVSDRLLRVDPLAFTGLLTAGAATTFLERPAVSVEGGVGVVTVLTHALVGSAFAVSASLTGIRLLGPGQASLLDTVEVPTALALATFALGEQLTIAQQFGAGAVVDAIVLLQLPARLPRRRLADVRPIPQAPKPAAEALAA